MKPFQVPFFHWVFALSILSGVAARGMDPAPAGQADNIRVLLVHGGHDFQTNQFFRMFQDLPQVTMRAVEHPKAHAWFKTERAGEYDVLVFYDMWQNISEEAKADLVRLLQQGKPLVALHHSLGSYQKWDEYAHIIGGKYHLEKWTENGVQRPGSTYKHDVQFRVQVADREHPVTRGLGDFTIHDETYGGLEVKPDSHVLLKTDEPTSGPDIAWVKQYGKARVVTIQLGHDRQAYENPHFRKLVAQAIGWAAKRDPVRAP